MLSVNKEWRKKGIGTKGSLYSLELLLLKFSFSATTLVRRAMGTMKLGGAEEV